ncbi:MAG: hypothetical protein R6V62_05060 [Candidatus Fermentibacteraceae bacterium]
MPSQPGGVAGPLGRGAFQGERAVPLIVFQVLGGITAGGVIYRFIGEGKGRK